MKGLTQSALDKIVERTVAKKHIHGAVFHVTAPGQGLALSSAGGNLEPEGLYYIASINKLFVSALILRLCREGQLRLSDKLAGFLPADHVQGVHVYKGRDYSGAITIGQLLTQTAGLPCYLIDKHPSGVKVMEGLLQGQDEPWPTDKVLTRVKEMAPKYPPGQTGKANYGNTTFRLLGKVLEAVKGASLSAILEDLFGELGLQKTFVFRPGEQPPFAPVYFKAASTVLSRYFSSSGFDIVSNAGDQMAFLQAFFGGYFYPKEQLLAPGQWNRIFFPFKYGMGMQQFSLPRILSPFKPFPQMMGHAGSTGSFAFYVPQKDLYMTGTVNQASSPGAAFQAMVQIVNRL